MTTDHDDGFLGRYELLGLIATGGMGKVYLARAVGEGGFEREVALKVMHDHLLLEPDFIGMFLDEARLAARIRHPHVVPTLDIQKTDTNLFLVMEFVEGLTASSLLKQLRRRARAEASVDPSRDSDASAGGSAPGRRSVSGPVPVAMAARIVVDVLSGLHAAHELTDRDRQPLNLVHRDVSPGNVLIGSDGVARITDFGVARAETRLTSTMGGQIKGKLPYMPPEQVLANRVDRQADIYSAGVVLWELLVGHRLFRAEEQGALIHRVVEGAASTPKQHNPQVPPSVDEACMRALDRAPDARYATAADFGEALEEAVRSAGLRLASRRELAQFVASFDTNVSAMAAARRTAPRSTASMQRIELEVASATQTSPLAPTLPQGPETGGSASGPLLGTGAPLAPESGSGSFASMPSAGSTRTAAIVSTMTAAPPRSRLGALGWMLGGAALALIGGALGVLVIVNSDGSPAPGATAGASAPTLQADLGETAVAAPVKADTDADGGAPVADVEPSAAPSAVARTEPRARPRPRIRPKASPKTPKPTPATRGPADEPLPSEFLPGEL